jgi:hypothetical protein
MTPTGERDAQAGRSFRLFDAVVRHNTPPVAGRHELPNRNALRATVSNPRPVTRR